MIWFILLAILLVILIALSIALPLYFKNMSKEQFDLLCTRKIKRVGRKNKLNFITNLKLLNYNREKINVDHVIFGKKYIYLISDFMLKGFISGDDGDNSWVYYDKIAKSNKYLRNLNKFSKQNISDFASILGVGTDLFVTISLVPNNCDFKIKNLNKEGALVVHSYSLKRKIKMFEKQQIGSLDEKQIYEKYESIRNQNRE